MNLTRTQIIIAALFAIAGLSAGHLISQALKHYDRPPATPGEHFERQCHDRGGYTIRTGPAGTGPERRCIIEQPSSEVTPR